MPFQPKNQYGKLGKRKQSPTALAVKDYIEGVSDRILKTIDFDKLTDTQKIQFLKVTLPYMLPKFRHIEVSSETDLQQSFQIEIIDSTEQVENL